MNNLAFQIYGSTKSGIFQSTWDTTKTSTGSSASNQITLPLLSSGTYNFWIDWGDGSTTNVTSYSQRTHTYTSAGTYTLRVTGIITGWGFQNTGDKLKILTISSWGKLKNLTQGFYGCSNLTLSGITDILDLTGTTSLGAMFSGCSKITTVGRMNEWDTSLITSMSNMFVACVLFNQPLNNWNTGNVTGFVNMFTGCFLFNQCLGSWNVTKCTSFEGMFNACTNFNNGDNSVPLNNWVLNTTAASVSLNYTFGSCSSFNRYLGGWDTSKVNIMASLFSGCTVFNNGYASGIANQLTWNTSACTSMSSIFQSCTAFNSNLGTGTTPWDVSKVTDFLNMFRSASNFKNGDDTAPINNWNINTISSISMSAMFFSASVFNRNISSWNVSKVNNFGGMFQNTNSFNNGYASGVSNQLPWTINTTSNIDMSQMFANASAFNSNLGTGTTPWNVSKVTSFTAMFNGASNFNNGDDSAPINNWSINTTATSVAMNQMFQSSKFNRYIGDWNVSKVTAMGNMFLLNTSFNQDLSKWNVGSVTSMDAMFYSANAFTNGSNTNTNPITGLTGINGWNINTTAASVTMPSMFAQNTVFNQPIGSWNVSKVTIMDGMFYNATAFNQNIGAWNISQVTNFTNFMYGKTPATFSYLDAIYNGWSALPSLKPNINISFGGAKYTAAGTAGRLTLTSAPNNWIIQDGGL